MKTTDIKNTLTFKFTCEEAQELSIKLNKVLYVIYKKGSICGGLFISEKIESGAVLFTTSINK